MGTFYNSRLLEWMEVGRSEWARAAGIPYAEWEKRGVYAPIIEANLKFSGRAGYDDILELKTVCSREGRVRLKFETTVVHAESGRAVAEGFTLHALTDREGKPLRVPEWIDDLVNREDTNE
jgi:acyl-CoA thioester hydrolase